MIFSIVTPTLNARCHIADCIESVRRQRVLPGVEVEHVIVDGGSTDGTIEYAESRGVRVLVGKDKGIFDAVNRGSRESRGDWLGFLGADDLLLDGAIQALADAARQTPARWLTGGVRYIDADLKPLGRLEPPPTWVPPRMIACLGWSPIHHIATWLRRDFFEELGGFDIRYTVAADYDLFCRAAQRARVHRVPAVLAAMRRTGVNFSTKNEDLGRRQCAEIRDSYGPRSRYSQHLYRQALRLWVNAANPTWSFRKLYGRPY